MYITRKLNIETSDDRSKEIYDLDLLTEVQSSSIVILAEAGMGKTDLMKKLAEQQGYDTKFLTATDLVNKSLARLRLAESDILLIDAFDELPSSNDGTGIDNVLNKLAEIGTKRFIITCRSIEWDSSNQTEISADFGKIYTATLHSLTYKESQKFLQDKGLSIDTVTNLLDNLDKSNLSSFYENPRNLSLLAEIDYSSNSVPTNKSELFELATSKLWQEINPKANNTLSTLNAKDVLDCAGCIFANYLLTGKQFVFKGNTASTPDDAINIFSLDNIVNRELLKATIRSRLFQSIDTNTNLLKPWHRSIAEYLGAKWLAERMTSSRIRRQMLSYLIIDDGVISSLRGIFAWLPKFNTLLSNDVIKTDPYGLIEYADTSYLSDSDSQLLFDSLQKMAEDNPFFRKNTYYKQAKSEALAKPCLLENIREVLTNKPRNFHFLTTILEVLQDADFVDELSDELFDIAYDNSRFYSERYDAFMLLHSKGLIQSSGDFNPLITEASEDSLRLSFEYAKKYGYDLLTDKQVISLIMKSYDFKDKSYFSGRMVPRNGSDYYFLEYPVDRIETLLKNIRQGILALNIDKFGYSHYVIKDINKLIFSLIQRYLTESDTPLDSLVFYQSLSIFYTMDSNSYNDNNTTDFFTNYFNNYPSERLKIQQHFIDYSNDDFRFYRFRRSVFQSLYPTPDNCKKLLVYIQNQPITKEREVQWKGLIAVASGIKGLSEDIYHLALPYCKNSVERTIFLEKQKEPFIDEWAIRDKRFEQQQILQNKLRHQKLRNDLYPVQSKIEQGDTEYCYSPASILIQSYSDIPDELTHLDRIRYVYQDKLTDSAIKGFEASLHQQLLPTISELMQTKFPIEPVLMAGIYCRLLAGQTLDDLSDEVIIKCAVILDYNHYLSFTFDNSEYPAVKQTIKAEVIKRGLKPKIINEMFIPQFQLNCSSIQGLHWVYGKNADELSINTIVILLNTYPTMDKHAKNQFIDTLILNNQLDKIKELIITNANLETTNDIKNFDEWLSLLSVIDENLFFENIPCVTYPNSLFWQLHDTYYETRLSKRPKMTLRLMSWIAYRFSYIFPNTRRPNGVSSGNRNMWQASEFILFCLSQISNIATQQANEELHKLKRCVHASYRMEITNFIAEQTDKIREKNYQPPQLDDLLNIIQNNRPKNCKDLKTLFLELLTELQDKIYGNETDSYKVFFKDVKNRISQGENDCRDRLADLIKPYIEQYGFSLDTEADMPNDKRADLVIRNSQMQLPIEVKGQWHKDLWTAMNDQLGKLYLKEYQSQGQGIYLVFYFGDNASKKLTKDKVNNYSPKNAQELQEHLTACIDNQYQNGIDVFVVDLSLNN